MQFLRRISQMRLKFFVKNHRKNKLHQAKVTSSYQGKQTYIQPDQATSKGKKIVSSFLAVDISLHELNHPALKSVCVAMGKSLHSKTAPRASVAP